MQGHCETLLPEMDEQYHKVCRWLRNDLKTWKPEVSLLKQSTSDKGIETASLDQGATPERHSLQGRKAVRCPRRVKGSDKERWRKAAEEQRSGARPYEDKREAEPSSTPSTNPKQSTHRHTIAKLKICPGKQLMTS